MRARLGALALTYGSQAKAAKHWEVSAQMVSLVIRGQRPPTETMLAELRLEPIPAEVRYRVLG